VGLNIESVSLRGARAPASRPRVGYIFFHGPTR
jgi:hypothetical protein